MRQVDAVGTLLVVNTDLAFSDVDTAVDMCRAGMAYLSRVGAFAGAVSVYGSGNVGLARASSGSACASRL